MSDQALNYVPYSDDVEQIQPNEEQDTEETLASFDRLRRMTFDKHRHAYRDAHAKSHGIVTGELTIYDNLPKHLVQGIFQPGKKYGVVIRYSTAPSDISPDNMATFRGMAVKVIGVEGTKVLPNEADALTQDFLLVSFPTIAGGTVAKFLKQQLLLEQTAKQPEEMQTAGATALRVANEITERVGFHLPPTPVGLTQHQNHPLGETFFSQAALRYGNYVAKVRAAPLSENLKALTDKPIEEMGPSILRDLIVDFFRNNESEYELQVQLCTDLEKMPVEDASVEWSEKESPYQPVGKITLNKQEAYSPGRRTYGDDVLSFNPWHCIPEHRPLGSIQRIRIKAYELSTKFRHDMNVKPRVEPRDISEIPD